MWVMPVRTLLDTSKITSFVPHEEAQLRGLVVEWTPGLGNCLFCSHTWLRGSHPDNAEGTKFALLQSILERIIAGTLDVSTEWQTELVYQGGNMKGFGLNAADLKKDLSDGFVFFDLISIPQADRAKQAAAISALPRFVANCVSLLAATDPPPAADTPPPPPVTNTTPALHPPHPPRVPSRRRSRISSCWRARGCTSGGTSPTSSPGTTAAGAAWR